MDTLTSIWMRLPDSRNVRLLYAYTNNIFPKGGRGVLVYVCMYVCMYMCCVVCYLLSR